MSRIIIFAIFYICLIFSPDVKASCLEYGHSCWGAHGKRSGAPTVGGNKAQHGLGKKNLRSYELNALGDDNTNRNEEKFDFDDAFASAENLLRRTVSAEDFSNDMHGSTKTVSRLKFPEYARESEINSVSIGSESKPNKKGVEERDQQHRWQQQQQSSLSLQQQRKYPQHVERWRRFPFYASRPSIGNSPLALTDTAPTLNEIQHKNSENDFVQQFGKLTDGRLDDNGPFYDVL